MGLEKPGLLDALEDLLTQQLLDFQTLPYISTSQADPSTSHNVRDV